MHIEGVILAAGLSQRMKAHKMTLTLRGKSLIQRVVENFYPFCQRIIVVGGYGIQHLRPLLHDYKKVELIFNSDYLEGMYSSVKKGLAQVRGERFFLSPGDYPLIQKNVLQALLNEVGEIIIPTYQNRKGHPVLFQHHLAKEILNRPQYHNLREFIHDRGYKTVEVPDKGILMDMDTPEDYQHILEYFSP